MADSGLDPDLSSCALQYAACAKYVEEQRAEGWVLSAERFDDDGESGATTQRPALDRLLTRVSAGEIDCVIVFRLDRLTRSVSDWARLSRGLADRARRARALQDALDARQTRTPLSRDPYDPATDPFILRGLVRCTRCLKPMTTSTGGPRWRRTRRRTIRNDARFYRCRRQGCAGSQVSAALIEGKVGELLLFPPDNVDEHLIEFIEIGVRLWDVLIIPNRARLCRSIFDAILWDGRTGKVKPIWAGPDEVEEGG